jgi:FtsZ-binding cell division protein ZapB
LVQELKKNIDELKDKLRIAEDDKEEFEKQNNTLKVEADKLYKENRNLKDVV